MIGGAGRGTLTHARDHSRIAAQVNHREVS